MVAAGLDAHYLLEARDARVRSALSLDSLLLLTAVVAGLFAPARDRHSGRVLLVGVCW